MDLYKNGEFGAKHITMNEILTKAGQPDLLDRMSLDELQYLCNNSKGMTKLLFSELISRKYGVCNIQKQDILKYLRYHIINHLLLIRKKLKSLRILN